MITAVGCFAGPAACHPVNSQTPAISPTAIPAATASAITRFSDSPEPFLVMPAKAGIQAALECRRTLLGSQLSLG